MSDDNEVENINNKCDDHLFCCNDVYDTGLLEESNKIIVVVDSCKKATIKLISPEIFLKKKENSNTISMISHTDMIIKSNPEINIIDLYNDDGLITVYMHEKFIDFLSHKKFIEFNKIKFY